MCVAAPSSRLPPCVAGRAQPCGGPQPGRRGVVLARAVAGVPSVADTRAPAPDTSAAVTSNIVTAPLEELEAPQRRKAELQRQALAALEADNAWWRAGADAPPNLVAATSPAEYKRLIMGAAPGQLVVVDYLKPSCAACRRLMPKVHQIAASNPDILVIKVNVDESPEMQDLGRGMGVAHLPWFHLWLGGEIVQSFSANVTTVATLRAEIANFKPCSDPGCEMY